MVVFAIAVKVENGETALSHLTTEPMLPLNVKLPADNPEHTALVPEIVPATVAGSTVTEVVVEFADAQAPLCTTALN